MKLVLIYIFQLLVFSTFSQTIEDHNLTSDILDDQRQVKVWLPENYSDSLQYPVVYLFDAAYLFNITSATVEYLSQYAKIPECIVIGICFKPDDRNFDMSSDFFGTGELHSSGQNFYQYVLQDLIPFVNNNYSVTNFTTIIGHSNSSTFLNHFLFDENGPVFNNYIALSQVFTGKPKEDFNLLFEKDFDPICYYTGIGLKDADLRISNPRNTKKWLDSVEYKPNFNYKFEEFDQFDHSDIYFALNNGLRFTFKDFVGISDQFHYDYDLNTYVHDKSKKAVDIYFDQNNLDPLEYIQEESKRVSDLYGIEVKPSYDDDFSILSDYASLKQNEAYMDQVILYFEQLYPNNPVLLQFAAQGYRRIGSWEKMESYFWKYNEHPEAKGKTFAYNYLLHSFDRFMKNPKKTWDLLEKYRKAFPNYHYPIYKFGAISAKYKFRMKEGIEYLKEYIKISNGEYTEQAHLNLAKIHIELDEKDLAKSELSILLDLNPDSKEALQLMQKLNGT